MKLFLLITLLGVCMSGSTGKEKRKCVAVQKEVNTLQIMPGLLF